MVLNTAIETFNENSAHLVFTAQDGQNYALTTDLKNGTVSFTVSINTCNFKGNQGEINECLSNSDFIKSDSLVRDRLSACAGLKEIKLVTKRAPLQVHLQRYFEFQCTVLSSDRKSNEDNLVVFMKIR